MTQVNSYFEDVEVTNLSLEEREKVRNEHINRLGFKNFATGWENGKMFYTFWYVGDQTLSILEQLTTEERDIMVKARSMSCLPEQGNGTNPKPETSGKRWHP
jgi:mRNA deadenylase 3'-5' endonuclease subunit Ccr4